MQLYVELVAELLRSQFLYEASHSGQALLIYFLLIFITEIVDMKSIIIVILVHNSRSDTRNSIRLGGKSVYFL